MLLVSTVNTYSLNGVIGAQCTMITSAQLIGNPSDVVPFGKKTFSTPQNPVLISNTLLASNFLNTGDWVVTAYDEWQKPSYEYDAPQVSAIETSVNVAY